MRVCQRFKFDAAHYLPDYAGKCKNLHGHTWYLDVKVEGGVDTKSGFIIDFSTLKLLVQHNVLDFLDHVCLNDIGVSSNPTCENIIRYIWRVLQPILSTSTYRLCCLRLYESLDSYAEITNWVGEEKESNG